MKKFFIFFWLVLIWQFCDAATYPVSAIPEALKKDANVVKRLDETRIEIKGPGRARIYRHYAYTILNEGGDPFSVFFSYYDKFRDIAGISGTLYDADGNKLKNVKKKDIIDESGNFGSHLAMDARYKIHSFYHKIYPYTVEYEEEVDLDGIFYLPEWLPQRAEKLSIENARMEVVTPKDYELRYKMFRYPGSPLIREEKNTKSYVWELKSVNAKIEESFAPEWQELVTRVLIAPSDFEIKDYKGNMKTWQNFGMFMQTLYAGRDVLPENIKARVKEFTANLKTDREKVHALYKFMQDNTHYISIQLGIGGWQPLDATYVAEKKYGDCKALSNYMVALLKEAGIKGYNALITGGDEEKNMIIDFPSNQFNHVVVCVPVKGDSIWLECTSQTVAPGYMGNFTGNREALLIDGSNSRIVHTPVYTKDLNIQNRAINAEIDADGKLNGRVVTTATGIQQEELHHIVNGISREDQLKRLRSSFRLPNYEITKFTYQEGATAKVPMMVETLQLESKDYATITGKRLFVRPNVLSTYINKLTNEEKRENEIVYEYAFIDRDTVNIKLPEGYNVETQPKPLTINNKFGRYSTEYSFKDGSLQHIRIFERNAGRFPASDYNDFIEFYNAIYKADNARMVFVKAGE